MFHSVWRNGLQTFFSCSFSFLLRRLFNYSKLLYHSENVCCIELIIQTVQKFQIWMITGPLVWIVIETDKFILRYFCVHFILYFTPKFIFQFQIFLQSRAVKYILICLPGNSFLWILHLDASNLLQIITDLGFDVFWWWCKFDYFANFITVQFWKFSY